MRLAPPHNAVDVSAAWHALRGRNGANCRSLLRWDDTGSAWLTCGCNRARINRFDRAGRRPQSSPRQKRCRISVSQVLPAASSLPILSDAGHNLCGFAYFQVKRWDYSGLVENPGNIQLRPQRAKEIDFNLLVGYFSTVGNSPRMTAMRIGNLVCTECAVAET